MLDACLSVCQLVTYGNMYRRRGRTGVNANSSRSHAVLQIDLRHKNQADKLARLVFSFNNALLLNF